MASPIDQRNVSSIIISRETRPGVLGASRGPLLAILGQADAGKGRGLRIQLPFQCCPPGLV
jgi:hypothetical protein